MRRRSFLALIAAASVPALGFAWHIRSTASFDWRHDHPDFGGLSAFHLWPDGLRFLALSDRGRFFDGRLERASSGVIVAARVSRVGLLQGPEGRALRGREIDSEGIAIAPDGTIHVAFEGPGGGRIWRYDRIDGPAVALPLPDAFRAHKINSSLEALAVDANGRLFTLPEADRAGVFDLWRFDGQWQRVGEVPKRGGFLPVGADFGPDGLLYLLERRFVMPVGFASRLSVLASGAWDRPRTLWESRLGQFDNLEGLSLGRTAGGGLRATMVSDDNFLPVQRTEIVEIMIDP
jgi:hypothetical protein